MALPCIATNLIIIIIIIIIIGLDPRRQETNAAVMPHHTLTLQSSTLVSNQNVSKHFARQRRAPSAKQHAEMTCKLKEESTWKQIADIFHS